MWNKEEREEKVDQSQEKIKKPAGDPTHAEERRGAGDADRSQDGRASPTRLPGIPGHGMTSNMPEDED